jgi:undecaprenyl-diphosphatase
MLFGGLHDPTFSRIASWANGGHGRFPVLIAVLAAISAVSAGLTFVAFRAALRTWWGRAPAAAAAGAIDEHTGARRFVHDRLEADVATGLALTLALVAIVVAGLVVAALAVAVRHVEGLSDIDSAAALWANRHTGSLQHRLLEDVSTLATTGGVIVIAVVVGAAEWVRVPSRTIPAFLAVVTIGDSLVTNAIKAAIDRARPAIDPVAATLGPSFPSGHSSTAAALFAALALLAGRRRGVRARAALAGAAVGIAVAVACSRVMLDLHWTSDVVGGLVWGWFAACAIAFGGWLVEFGAPVERAAGQPGPAAVSRPGDRPRADASAAVGARRPGRPAPPGRS